MTRTFVPLTCLITKGEGTPDDFNNQREGILRTISLAVKASISIVQIREKRLTALQQFRLACDAAAITSGSTTKLIVNDRADIAFASGADGVHLPENGMPVKAVRSVCPSGFLIGSSVHTLSCAVSSAREGADFLLFGPIFNSGEKLGVGIDPLKAVCEAVQETPVVAVGGIDGSNLGSVLAAGASGYAAIRYLNDHAVLKNLI